VGDREGDAMGVSLICTNQNPFSPPFALSLSKGFDKLSPNGVLC
jgi:hypothetical protein